MSLSIILSMTREKGITTLRTYQYQIFHHPVIETCFAMLKSSEHERYYDAIQTINPPILRIVRKLYCWSPNFILLLNSENRGPWSMTMSLSLFDTLQTSYTLFNKYMPPSFYFSFFLYLPLLFFESVHWILWYDSPSAFTFFACMFSASVHAQNICIQ